ncbi:MAG: FG-GAP repeat protein [Deltaproteobacteria bacterium]|nr:FG-GAP repeat protein [Candidatus Anaeroferrophillacea bacterium]
MKKWSLSACMVLFCLAAGVPAAWAQVIYPSEIDGLKGFGNLVKGSEREIQLGWSMVSGDFNGDGKTDVAVGVPRAASPRGIVEAGVVSIYFGGADLAALPDSCEAVDYGDETESALLYGGAEHEYVGENLAVGDLNDDGIDDLIVAAQRVTDTDMPVSPEDAKIYVVYGGSGLSGNLAIAAAAATVIRRADSMHVQAMATGDVNGDGTDDLLVSDILTDSVQHPPVAPLVGGLPRGLNGAVYLFYGSAGAGSPPGGIDPATDANVTFRRDAGAGVFQVMSLAVGDFNRDRKLDIAFGAPDEDSVNPVLAEAGRVYVVNGGTAWGAQVEADDADTVISGAYVKDQVGGTLAAVDFNADGYDDLVIGAPLSGWGEAGTTGKGRVLVVYGKGSWAANLDLYEDSDVTLRLSDAAGRIGFKTGQAIVTGDYNGDGTDDLVISTPNAFAVQGTNGWVYVVYGSSAPARTNELDQDADIAIIGPEVDASDPDPLAAGRMGYSMAAGDFDDDGRYGRLGTGRAFGYR